MIVSRKKSRQERSHRFANQRVRRKSCIELCSCKIPFLPTAKNKWPGVAKCDQMLQGVTRCKIPFLPAKRTSAPSRRHAICVSPWSAKERSETCLPGNVRPETMCDQMLPGVTRCLPGNVISEQKLHSKIIRGWNLWYATRVEAITRPRAVPSQGKCSINRFYRGRRD